jgi:transcriptional regulator
MFIAKDNRNTDLNDIRDFLKGNSFAILISQLDGRPWATHIPLELDTDKEGKDVLNGHLSRGNPQWREFASHPDVLAIFNGPNAYISSSWYDHENVPTWNYIAVHIYGKIRIVEGGELLEFLKKQVDKHEKASTHPVSIERMSKAYVENEMKGIVGFQIKIDEIQAAYKLSQNRDMPNRENIIKELEKRGDVHSLNIAKEMKKRKLI